MPLIVVSNKTLYIYACGEGREPLSLCPYSILLLVIYIYKIRNEETKYQRDIIPSASEWPRRKNQDAVSQNVNSHHVIEKSQSLHGLEDSKHRSKLQVNKQPGRQQTSGKIVSEARRVTRAELSLTLSPSLFLYLKIIRCAELQVFGGKLRSEFPVISLSRRSFFNEATLFIVTSINGVEN